MPERLREVDTKRAKWLIEEMQKDEQLAQYVVMTTEMNMEFEIDRNSEPDSNEWQEQFITFKRKQEVYKRLRELEHE